MPGTKMTFAGMPEAEDRADIIAYLRTLSDRPVPLPAVTAQAAPPPHRQKSQPAQPRRKTSSSPAGSSLRGSRRAWPGLALPHLSAGRGDHNPRILRSGRVSRQRSPCKVGAPPHPDRRCAPLRPLTRRSRSSRTATSACRILAFDRRMRWGAGFPIGGGERHEIRFHAARCGSVCARRGLLALSSHRPRGGRRDRDPRAFLVRRPRGAGGFQAIRLCEPRCPEGRHCW